MSIFNRRAGAYRKVFQSPDGKRVLADLRRFCRADTSCADVTNVHTTFLLEGRREVWLRIQAQLALTDEQITQLVEDYSEFDT